MELGARRTIAPSAENASLRPFLVHFWLMEENVTKEHLLKIWPRYSKARAIDRKWNFWLMESENHVI